MLGLTHRRDEGLSRFDFADLIPLINRACVARGFRLTPKQFGDTETVERFVKDVPILGVRLCPDA